MKEQKTGIIESVRVGFVEYYRDIALTCNIDMNGSGCTLTFTMEQAKKMMNDCKVRNINDLIGKPCEIMGGWGEKCSFLGMWKK